MVVLRGHWCQQLSYPRNGQGGFLPAKKNKKTKNKIFAFLTFAVPTISFSAGSNGVPFWVEN